MIKIKIMDSLMREHYSVMQTSIVNVDITNHLIVKFLDKPSMSDQAFLKFQMNANSLYYAYMYFGSYKERMKLLLDTCSSVIIVANNLFSGSWWQPKDALTVTQQPCLTQDSLPHTVPTHNQISWL